MAKGVLYKEEAVLLGIWDKLVTFDRKWDHFERLYSSSKKIPVFVLTFRFSFPLTVVTIHILFSFCLRCNSVTVSHLSPLSSWVEAILQVPSHYNTI